MADFLLLEQLYKIIRDIPKPRVIFRKGIIARGFFRPYMSFSDYTKAQLFDSPERITPVTVRFSSMLGDRGTPDTVRNIKGMDAKFHTAHGNYDMMCRSLPVCFTDSVEKYEAFKEAFSRLNLFDGVNSSAFWRFIVDNPEALNCCLRFFSCRGLSDSYIYINMFSVNTVIWENEKGEKRFIRYRWCPVKEDGSRSDASRKFKDSNTAEFLAGFDPDRGFREIYADITEGRFPHFELQVQMMEDSSMFQKSCRRQTLCWNEKLFPVTSVGRMRLETLEENCRESDLLSFAPGRTVEGIELYRDEMSAFMDHFFRIEAIERGAPV